MDKRIKWVDNARGLCIFCVLLAHCNVEHTILHHLYTPWFLVLFFFISGFLYKTRSLKEELFRLTKRLIIPYFLLSLLLFLVGIDNWKAIMGGDYAFVWNKLKTIMIGKHLWFIPCIIMVQLYYILLTHSLVKDIKTKTCVVVICLSSVYFIKNNEGHVAPYCCDIAIFALAFFTLGNIICTLVKNGKFANSKIIDEAKKPIISWCLLVAYFIGSYVMQNTIHMEFHFAENIYEKPLCFILLAIFGIATVCLAANTFDTKYLQKLGENSLTAFAFNGKAYAIACMCMNFISLNNTLYAILLCLFEGFILIILSYFINRFVPWLIGK